MVRIIIKLQIIIIFSSLLSAIPRFAIQEGASCNLCHIDPNGGGLRNEYGIIMTSKEDLPRSPGGKISKNYTGIINDHIRVGGDIRFLNFNTMQSNQVTSALFPMQSNFYGYWKISEAGAVFASMDLLRSNNEIWVNWDGLLPMNGYLKVGKDLPAYGLNVDDHTSFIRGGNIRKKSLLQEGLIFSPYLSYPGLLEIGFNFGDIYLSQSISNQFINYSSSGGFDEYLHDKAFTTRIEWFPTLNRINGMIGASLLQQGIVRFQGIFGGISLGKLTWVGEVDIAENWLSDGTVLASLSELTYDFIPGVDLQVKFDFFDEDIDTTGGALQRLTFGVEYVPVPFVGLNIQARLTEVIGSSEAIEPEFLIQLHTWF